MYTAAQARGATMRSEHLKDADLTILSTLAVHISVSVSMSTLMTRQRVESR